MRKIVLVGLLAFGLMVLDNSTAWLSPVYRVVDSAVRPLYWITNIPARIQEWGKVNVTSRAVIEQDNARLQKESLIHRAQLQRMAELAAENLRLRQLLNATELLMDSVLVTEVIGVSRMGVQWENVPKSHPLTSLFTLEMLKDGVGITVD